MHNLSKLYISEDKSLFYCQTDNYNNSPTIIFLHGLKSSMESKKAKYLESYCIRKNIHFIRFDNYGHGSSSGVFIKENLSSWLEGAQKIIQHLANENVILIGSSIGAWLGLILAQRWPERIKGLIGIASAPDFTKDIEDKLSSVELIQLKKRGLLYIKSKEDPNKEYEISYDLIKDSKQYLFFRKTDVYENKKISILCPIHLLHGMQDQEVDYTKAIELANRLNNSNLVVKLNKNSKHDMSNQEDLDLILQSLKYILRS